MPTIEKPFDVTKAVDFSDTQIAATWVDLPDGGFFQLLKPRSPMPLMLLGGKGSGRTHLMRYYSYPLQKLRAGNQNLVEFLSVEQYVGVYMRCEGLNAGRFNGKGQDPEAWLDIFAYYMDLWLAELAVITLSDPLAGREEFHRVEPQIVGAIAALCDLGGVESSTTTVADLIALLKMLRREVDIAVNNAALSRSLGGLRIRSTRGRLVFETPKLFSTHLSWFREMQTVYLIDELENLTEPQQTYVNTLLREKEPPCTFRIGSRLYGFRTQRTMSADEENRIGSEYEQLILDDMLRVSPRYDRFAMELIATRLRNAGYEMSALSGSEINRQLNSLFEEFPASTYEESQTRFIDDNYKPDERPYLAKLNTQLSDALVSKRAPGVSRPSDVKKIVRAMKCLAFPLLEKVNILLLYQDWAKGRDLASSANEIRASCDALIDRNEGERHKRLLSHFKGDLLAQLLRECRQDQRYFGLQTFIDMSSGLPRHLLIVLKFVHNWSLFYGERPFEGKPIGFAAQRAGVLQAANWFFEDARAAGVNGRRVQSAVERLARFLHELRFADKPVESSLCTFSFRESLASGTALENITEARNVSLLLHVLGGQKDRNDEGVDPKYQLNPLLCPRFDLPISRRGTIALNPDELEAIFGDSPDNFNKVLATRLAGMNAPFRRIRRTRGGHSASGDQGALPGLE